MQLMTIGYEGSTIDKFFDVLKANRIQTLVDIRELPLSRKRGFSKTALAATTALKNLNYLHIPALGSPKDVRHDYRDDNDWQRYTDRFCKYLDGQSKALEDLALLASSNRCCLLCFEANPLYCHRLYVAQRVAAIAHISIQIVHLQTTTVELTVQQHFAVA